MKFSLFFHKITHISFNIGPRILNLLLWGTLCVCVCVNKYMNNKVSSVSKSQHQQKFKVIKIKVSVYHVIISTCIIILTLTQFVSVESLQVFFL